MRLNRLWFNLVTVPAGTLLGAYAVVRTSLIEMFTGSAAVFIVAGTVGWVAWWTTIAFSTRYRWACCIGCALAAFVASRLLGNDMTASAVRAEIPLLLREIEAHENDSLPRSFKIQGARYLQKVSMRRESEGDGIVAFFGLPSGSIIRYFSSASGRKRVAGRPCTDEIQPGWYWTGRCE